MGGQNPHRPCKPHTKKPSVACIWIILLFIIFEGWKFFFFFFLPRTKHLIPFRISTPFFRPAWYSVHVRANLQLTLTRPLFTEVEFVLNGNRVASAKMLSSLVDSYPWNVQQLDESLSLFFNRCHTFVVFFFTWFVLYPADVRTDEFAISFHTFVHEG